MEEVTPTPAAASKWEATPGTASVDATPTLTERWDATPIGGASAKGTAGATPTTATAATEMATEPPPQVTRKNRWDQTPSREARRRAALDTETGDKAKDTSDVPETEVPATDATMQPTPDNSVN